MIIWFKILSLNKYLIILFLYMFWIKNDKETENSRYPSPYIYPASPAKFIIIYPEKSKNNFIINKVNSKFIITIL